MRENIFINDGFYKGLKDQDIIITSGYTTRASIKINLLIKTRRTGDTSYQSCKRTVLSSRYIVFDKKSIPMVACNLYIAEH